MLINAERKLSGSAGYLEVDGEEWAEISAFQLQAEIGYADVQIGFEVGKKMITRKGTGNITVHKVFSRTKPLLETLKAGKAPRINIVAWVADPDATDGKVERVAVKNATFSTLNIMQWKHGEAIDQEFPFECRVDNIEFLDAIE